MPAKKGGSTPHLGTVLKNYPWVHEALLNLGFTDDRPIENHIVGHQSYAWSRKLALDCLGSVLVSTQVEVGRFPAKPNEATLTLNIGGQWCLVTLAPNDSPGISVYWPENANFQFVSFDELEAYKNGLDIPNRLLAIAMLKKEGASRAA